MQIELCLNRNFDINNILKSKIYHKIHHILLQSGQIAGFPDKTKQIGVLIDYPYGLGNTNIREHEIIYSIRSGAKFIDLTLNPEFLQHDKMSELFKDIFSCYNICKEKNVILRPIIEYRLFDTYTIFDIAERLNNAGISSIIIGTGSIVDDINDNLIVCSQIIKKTGLAAIPTITNINKEDLEIFIKIGVKTFRFMSTSIIESLFI